ncbi:LD-carboxypeptidase [bacterium]|nr:LD-carboxypeptidase [bacterium]
MKFTKILPSKLNIGDTIGVVAPSNPIIGDNIEELNRAKEIVEKSGFKVKYSKNLFSNTNGYCSTAKEKAEDINEMFADKNVKMIWCAKGGNNSNSTFEYLDYELIRQNPKIICGYSDITSLTNIITENTGLVTFSGTNFKTIATDETDFSYKQALNRFLDGSLKFGPENEKYITIQEGKAEGELIGGNLSLTKELVCGKYSIDFTDKILFLEELGYESDPAVVSNSLYYMKQNGVFDKIKGLWIGNYQHESGITLEKIIFDVLENEYKFPIIKSNNFGHIENKTVIPIGTKAEINTNENIKIKLIEKCIKD